MHPQALQPRMLRRMQALAQPTHARSLALSLCLGLFLAACDAPQPHADAPAFVPASTTLPAEVVEAAPLQPAQLQPAQLQPAQPVRLQREPAPSEASRAALWRVPDSVSVGLLVQDLVTGEVREAQGSLTPMIPASTTKLVTAAAVLGDLQGMSGWWSTELTVPAGELGAARVSRLTLRGSADPTLSLNTLDELAAQAAARGITEVGEVTLDESVLDAESWEGALIEVPMTAFMPLDWLDARPQSTEDARAQLHAALVAALQSAGIAVQSPALALADAAGAEANTNLEEGVASVQSAPPEEILAATLRPSHNLLAEELLASVAAQPDAAGTLQAAGGRATDILHGWGVETRGLSLSDGSGLSRDNRLTARALVDLLAHMYHTGGHTAPYADPQATFLAGDNPYAEALAHAGVGGSKYGRGGTLASRMVGSGLDVRAKTGTLPGVSALAGYVVGQRSGHPLAFAVLMNGPDSSPILELRAAQDEWVAAVAAQY